MAAKKGEISKVVKGWELEKKWENSEWKGVCVYKDTFVVVKGKRMRWHDMDGKHESEITCEWLGIADDVEIFGDKVYISDKKKRAVMVAGLNGCKIKQISLPRREKELGGSLGLAVDGINNIIYVCSEGTNTIYKITQDGLVEELIIKGLNGPTSLCWTKDERLVVSNSEAGTVKIFDLETKKWVTYGGSGPSDGELSHPRGVCANDEENIIICDTYNDRLVEISEEGDFLQNIDIGEEIHTPEAISFGDGRLVVTTNDPHHIYLIKQIN